eukprot:4915295-Pyramimonas_sp.AAC.1
MIDTSNLVKGVPFAGENAPRYAPQTTASEDDLLFRGNNGINVLELWAEKLTPGAQSTDRSEDCNRLDRIG